MKKKKYYVYSLLDPEKPGRFEYDGINFVFNFEPFYIGKGKGKRCFQHFSEKELARKYNNIKDGKIHRIIRNGFDPAKYVVIIKDTLAEKQAYKLEMKYIKILGRIDIQTGILSNLSGGGDGGGIGTVSKSKGKTYEQIYGPEKSKEMKEIRKERFLGKNNPMFGKPGPMLGKNQSQKVKKRLSEFHSIPIVQLDKSGNLIREWESTLVAGRSLNLAPTAIGNCLSKRSKSAAGSYWFYKEAYDLGDFILPQYPTREQRKHKRKRYKIISPEGIEYIVEGLNVFCDQHNLSCSNMCNVAQGRYPAYKGWRCEHE